MLLSGEWQDHRRYDDQFHGPCRLAASYRRLMFEVDVRIHAGSSVPGLWDTNFCLRPGREDTEDIRKHSVTISLTGPMEVGDVLATPCPKLQDSFPMQTWSLDSAAPLVAVLNWCLPRYGNLKHTTSRSTARASTICPAARHSQQQQQPGKEAGKKGSLYCQRVSD